jgi:hypothetical protein
MSEFSEDDDADFDAYMKFCIEHWLQEHWDKKRPAARLSRATVEQRRPRSRDETFSALKKYLPEEK